MDSVMLTTNGVLETQDRRLDMLSAKYYVVSEWEPRYLEFRNRPDRFRFLYTFGDTDVYENMRAFPPAFLIPASGIEVIGDENMQLQRIKDPNFNAERCVILAEAPAELTASPAAVEAVEPRVVWTSWGLDDFEMDVTAPTKSVLVVSQMVYPGWKATIDGHAATIRTANYTFPSIILPEGNHHVRFSFEPLSFKAGALLSFSSIFVLVIMVLRGSHRPDQDRI
jgi:hypothetical protein